MINVHDYHYHLPEELVAHSPLKKRDSSKLLHINRSLKRLKSNTFLDLPSLLKKEDVLVFNQSKVYPAKLIGKKSTGKQVALLILEEVSSGVWKCLATPGLKKGVKLEFANLNALVIEGSSIFGEVIITFHLEGKHLHDYLIENGQTPIPPYIEAELEEKLLRTSYQTVYAKDVGSTAAPTAGLHFTKNLLIDLEVKGIQTEYITLHVGPGTFQRLRDEQFETKTLHKEKFNVPCDVANRLTQYKKDKRRLLAVGTTTTRALESAITTDGFLSGTQSTTKFIYPEYKFNAIDGLITNFHLPESSLLMMISAFCSKPNCDLAFETFADSFYWKMLSICN